MRFFLIALLAGGCIPNTGSDAKSGKGSSELASLYEGQSLANLQNWSDTEKVTDEDVEETKQEIMTALEAVGFTNLPTIAFDQIRVSYSAQEEVISVYSLSEYCVGEERDSCFHLEIAPTSSGEEHTVKVVRLPADDGLKDAVQDYSEDTGAEDILTALYDVFPHSLVSDQLVVSSFGEDDSLVVRLLTDEDPKRELRIESRDGSINNSSINSHYSYHLYQDEMLSSQTDSSTQP